MAYSYRSYPKRSKRRYTRKATYAKAAVVTPYKSVDIIKFLTAEFFSLSETQFTELAKIYKNLYGSGSYAYLLETYDFWKKGTTKLSSLTQRRILECVPQFLSDEKRFFILKSETDFYLNKVQINQRARTAKNLDEFKEICRQYESEYQQFDLSDLSWFVGRGIFSEEERSNFLGIARYLLLSRLVDSYARACDDLKVIKDKLPEISAAKNSALYTTFETRTVLSLKELERFDLDAIFFSKPDFPQINLFKPLAEKYLATNIINAEESNKVGALSTVIKAHEIALFVKDCRAILNMDVEASIERTFEGGGGRLALSFKLRTPRLLKRLLLQARVEWAGCALAAVCVPALIFAFWSHISALVALSGAVLTIGLISTASRAFFKATFLKKEISDGL